MNNAVVRAERMYQRWRNDELPANHLLIETLHDAITALREENRENRAKLRRVKSLQRARSFGGR